MILKTDSFEIELSSVETFEVAKILAKTRLAGPWQPKDSGFERRGPDDKQVAHAWTHGFEWYGWATGGHYICETAEQDVKRFLDEALKKQSYELVEMATC